MLKNTFKFLVVFCIIIVSIMVIKATSPPNNGIVYIRNVLYIDINNISKNELTFVCIENNVIVKNTVKYEENFKIIQDCKNNKEIWVKYHKTYTWKEGRKNENLEIHIYKKYDWDKQKT